MKNLPTIEINTIDDVIPEYIKGVNECKNKDELIEFLKKYGDMTADAQEQAIAIKDWDEFQRGLVFEREKAFAGAHWHENYFSIIMPRIMMEIVMTAEQFSVPFGLAYKRMLEEKLI